MNQWLQRVRVISFLCLFIPAVFLGCGKREAAIPPVQPEQEVVSPPPTGEPFEPADEEQPPLTLQEPAPPAEPADLPQTEMTLPTTEATRAEEPGADQAAEDQPAAMIAEMSVAEISPATEPVEKVETQPAPEQLPAIIPDESVPAGKPEDNTVDADVGTKADQPESSDEEPANPPPLPKPEIIITSPQQGSFYKALTTVSGKLFLSDGEPFPFKRIRNFSWSSSHTAETAGIIPEPDGGFSFGVSTAGFRSDIEITVQVETVDGYKAETSLVLENDRMGPLLEASVEPAAAAAADSTAPPAEPADAAAAKNEGTMPAEDAPVSTAAYRVRGRVNDAPYAPNTTGEIMQLNYRIVGSGADPVQPGFDDDGYFSFEIPQHDTAQVLELTAEDFHANRSSIILEIPGSGYTAASDPVDSVSAEPAETQTAPARPVSATPGETPQVSEPAFPVSISLASPAQKIVYRSSARIIGTVESEGLSPDQTEIVWEIAGTNRSGTVPVTAEGFFEAAIDTRGLTGTQILSIRAVAKDDIEIRTEALSALLYDDQSGPSVVIESPQNGSFYEAVMTVTGSIRETIDNAGPIDEIREAGWLIAGTGMSGPLKLNEDGSFLFRFSAIDLPDRISLVVWAEDFNTHRSEANTVLLNDGIGPHLLISTPAENSYYSGSLNVSGAVWNTAETPEMTDDVRSLSYTIDGIAEEPRFIFFEENGTYQIDVDTRDFEGPVTLKISAEDTLGNLETQILRLRDGKLSPEITVTAPVEQETYGLSFYLNGTVKDPYLTDDEYGGLERIEYRISSVEYQVDEQSLSGSTQPEEDGRFSFQIDASGLHGTQQITLTAMARNGNTATRSITIDQGEVSIPGVSLMSADGRILVDWVRLPFTSGYTLRLSEQGADGQFLPLSPVRVTEPPVEISDLRNGIRYSISLETEVRERSITSETYETIPLAPETLKPRIKPDYQRLELSWPAIPGTDGYDVLRSESPDSVDWETLAENLNGTSYTDHGVSYGGEYYYRIRPSGGIGIPSAASAGSSLSAPANKFETVAKQPAFRSGALETVGGYAFFAAREGGVHIVDITLPGTLEPIGSAPSEGATDIAVSGDYAYVSEGERGYKIFNIADPRSPYEVSRRKTVDARALAIEGTSLYIADGPAGLKIADISDPLYPDLVSRIETGNALDIAIGRGTVYLLTGKGMQIFVREGSSSIRPGGRVELDGATSFCVEEAFIYIIDEGKELIVVDASLPNAPVVTGRLTLPSAGAIEVYNDFAYITSDDGGFHVVDVYDPAIPMVFEKNSGGAIDDLSLSGSTLLSSGEQGLQRVNTYLFGKSYNTGSLALDATAHHIDLADGIIQVAQRASGLATLSSPDWTGGRRTVAASLPGYAESSIRWNGYTLVAAGNEGIKVYRDTGTGSNPVTRIDTVGDARDIRAADNLAAVTTDRGIELFSLPDAVDGQMITANSFSAIAVIPSPDLRAVVLDKNHLISADYREGLKLYDISRPSDPVALSEIDLPNLKSLVLIGNLLSVGGFGGIELYDISDPVILRKTASLEFPFVEKLASDGIYLYIAQGVQGVKIVDPWTERGPRLVSSCENVYAVDIIIDATENSRTAYVSSGSEINKIEIVIPPWLESRRGR